MSYLRLSSYLFINVFSIQYNHIAEISMEAYIFLFASQVLKYFRRIPNISYQIVLFTNHYYTSSSNHRTLQKFSYLSVKRYWYDFSYWSNNYLINMSYPSIEIVCGKCGCIINKMINLKSIKDVLRSSNGRCNTCGIQLNATDFTVKTEKH